MRRQRPTIATEITACIIDGRDPTVQELCTVADQIHRDLQIGPSAYFGGSTTDGGSLRLIELRFALVALGGAAKDPGKA